MTMKIAAMFAVIVWTGATASAPAAAAVALSSAPAVRATAVSGAFPLLAQPVNMTVDAGATADQTLHATDGDGDPLTFSKTAGPGYLTVTTTDPGTGAATGNVHLAPGVSEGGSSVATVTASDGALTDSRLFQVVVIPIPASPILTQPQDMTVDAGSLQVQTLHASDSNGDPLDFSLVSGPGYVTVGTTDPGFGVAQGELAAAPGFPVSGAATATVEVTDGVLSDQKSLLITVNAVHVAPVLTPPAPMTLLVGKTADQQLTAADANGDLLEFSKVSGPAYMTVTTINASAGIGNVRLAPGSGDGGTATGQIRVSDGFLSATAALSIRVVEPTPVPQLEWRVLAPFVDPRTSSGVEAAVANVINGKIYVSHGIPTYYLMSIYDIATNTWTHGGPTAPNSQFYGSNTASGGRALGKHYAMGGGGAGFGSNGLVEEFNPVTSSWRTVGAILTPPRLTFGAASWDDKIYAVGGYDLGLSRDVDRNDVYDPATDSWRSLAPLPIPVDANFATVAYQGKVYVFGGSDQFGRVVGFVQIYDIASNTWSPGSPMPTARAYAMAGVISGKIVVFGGDSGGDVPLAVTEIYDPPTNTWAPGPDMPIRAAQMARGATYDDSGIYCIGWGRFYTDAIGTDVMVLRNVSPLAAAVNIDPDVINLKSHARWVTAYIEPSGFDPVSIDVSSLRLAGSVRAGSKVATVGDHDRDGLPELIVKFGRDALDPLLTLGMNKLEVSGSLVTGEEFKGADSVRVIDPSAAHPSASVAPNPLNPAGVLTFTTTGSGPVSIRMFDLQGRLVRTLVDTKSLDAGSHEVLIDGRAENGEPLSSGLYFYRMESPNGNVTGRLAVVK